jgi:hypothetical protein
MDLRLFDRHSITSINNRIYCPPRRQICINSSAFSPSRKLVCYRFHVLTRDRVFTFIFFSKNKLQKSKLGRLVFLSSLPARLFFFAPKFGKFCFLGLFRKVDSSISTTTNIPLANITLMSLPTEHTLRLTHLTIT